MAYCITSTRYKVDLPAEHARCETHYARLLRLLPALAHRDIHTIGLPALAGKPVCAHFHVVERAAYTTSLHLVIEQPALLTGTVKSSRPSRQTFDVRLYHDAAMAEVVGFQQTRRPMPRQAYPNAAMFQPDEKAQWNRYLGDWLAYCQTHGRCLTRFDVAERGGVP
jgi:uncharacterized protein YqiB (DUF1249 family)